MLGLQDGGVAEWSEEKILFCKKKKNNNMHDFCNLKRKSNVKALNMADFSGTLPNIAYFIVCHSSNGF